MKAVILAGGKGQRLLPLTADRPKCMVEVAGKSIAARQLEWLASQGVDEVIFSCGYLWERIWEAIGEGGDYSVKVRYMAEDEPLGRGGGLRNALSLIDAAAGPLVVLNGDVLAQPQLAAMIDEHNSSQAMATLLLVPYVSDDAVVDLAEDGRILRFQEKPRLPYWISGGIYVIDPGIRDLLPAKGEHELSTFPALASQGRLRGYRYEGPWFSVDSFRDLEAATSAFGS